MFSAARAEKRLFSVKCVGYAYGLLISMPFGSHFSRVSEGMIGRSRCRPVDQQQALEVIIAADVVSLDRADLVFAGAMGMATENERHTLRIPGQHPGQGRVAGEGVPEQ